MFHTTSPSTLIARPFLQRFVGGFRKAEIDGAREVLLGTVDAMLGQQFLRADHAELVALLRADQVLAAFAARQRKIRRADVTASRQIRQQRVVFVVGMRRDHHDAADVVEAFQHQAHLASRRRKLFADR